MPRHTSPRGREQVSKYPTGRQLLDGRQFSLQPLNFDVIISRIGEVRDDLQSLESPAQPRSKMADLETFGPTAPFSIPRMLHASVHQAADSLDLVISIVSSGRSFPVISGFSLARSAMLASARCLWVLLPEDLETNIFRTKVILKDELRMLNKAINTGDEFRSLQGVSMEPAARAQLEEALNSLGKDVPYLNSEKMLRASAHEIEAWMARKNPNRKANPLTLESALHLWNIGSASAHGQGFVSSFAESAPELFKVFYDTIDTVSVNTTLASWKLRESFLDPITDKDRH